MSGSNIWKNVHGHSLLATLLVIMCAKNVHGHSLLATLLVVMCAKNAHVHSLLATLLVVMCAMSARVLADFVCSVNRSIDLHVFDNVVQHVQKMSDCIVRHVGHCEDTFTEVQRNAEQVLSRNFSTLYRQTYYIRSNVLWNHFHTFICSIYGYSNNADQWTMCSNAVAGVGLGGFLRWPTALIFFSKFHIKICASRCILPVGISLIVQLYYVQ